MQKIKNSRKKSLLIQYMLECKVCLGQSIICKNEVHPPLYIYVYIFSTLYKKSWPENDVLVHHKLQL